VNIALLCGLEENVDFCGGILTWEEKIISSK